MVGVFDISVELSWPSISMGQKQRELPDKREPYMYFLS